jgi:hypothetical protein
VESGMGMIDDRSSRTSVGNDTRDMRAAIALATLVQPSYLSACTIALPVPAPIQQKERADLTNGGRFAHHLHE